MAEQSRGAKFAAVTLNPKDQKLETIQRVVASILGRGGCETCGRIAVLRVDFVSDPPAELARENVLSFTTEG